MRLKCKRKDCQWEWEYKGKSKFYACCPQCKSSVRVPKEIEQDVVQEA